MIQTFALLLDSYRELNAKRLFWVVLGLTGLVVVLFASIGVDAGVVTLVGWHTSFKLPFLTPERLYKSLFVNFGIGFWLSWLASGLALVSTAGTIPDLLAGGSVDLYLSKPIGRTRLFLTKVAGGLLFVALQVAVFCVGCFAVFRLRGGIWLPGLFVAIPLVVLMFSYLFAVCVLIGVLTRSTITALLLTLLFWFVIGVTQWAEEGFLASNLRDQQHAARLDRQIAELTDELRVLRDKHPSTGPAATSTGAAATTEPEESGFSLFHPFGGQPHSRRQMEATLNRLRAERDDVSPDRWTLVHRVLLIATVPMPKTTATTELLERQLDAMADLPPAAKTTADEDAAVFLPTEGNGPRPGRGRRGGPGTAEASDRARAGHEVDVQLRARSATYIVGTSLAFEAVVLGLAAWLFWRRDY